MPPCARMTPRIPISIADQLSRHHREEIVPIHQLKKVVLKRKIIISAPNQRPALRKVSNFEGFPSDKKFSDSFKTVVSKFLFF